MAAVGHQRAGKASRIQVESTNLRYGKYDCSWRGDDLDTTNMESGGFEQGTIGINVLEWSISGPWDAQQNAYDDPPGLFPRDNLGTIKIYTNVSDNVFWNSPANRCLTSRNSAEVKGLVQHEASGKSNGSGWSAPTGSV